VGYLIDLFYLLSAIVASPWFVYRLVARGDWPLLRARFRAPLGEATRGAIWLHGSSAGEIALLVPVVKWLEGHQPATPIVISAYSSSGIAAARKAFVGHHVMVFPFDLSFVMRRVFRALDPRLVVVVESEFWPNFLACAHRRRVPVALINGKISERSRRAFLRINAVTRLIRELAMLGVQSDVHALRFRSLQVPSERIHVTGNMKYDLAKPPASATEAGERRAGLGLGQSEVVIIGGSVHEREDEALIMSFVAIRREHSDARLIIVPRYPADARRVSQLLQKVGLEPILRSVTKAQAKAMRSRDAVLVVDTIGELRAMYGVADIAFVGGSLFFRGGSKGGHNLMEPAVYGIPVLFGPHHSSFAETASVLENSGGGIEVADERALTISLHQLIDDDAERHRRGQAAARAIALRSGATQKNLDLLAALLNAPADERLRVFDRDSTMPPTSSYRDSR